MTVLNREIATQRALLMAETLEELGGFPVNDSSSSRICCTAAVEALEKGALMVQICDGRLASPLTEALAGCGTLIGKGVG